MLFSEVPLIFKWKHAMYFIPKTFTCGNYGFDCWFPMNLIQSSVEKN